MENYTKDDILALTMSEREKNHLSRSRKGRHVFISRYFLEYSTLPAEEQRLLVFGPVGSDDESYNSVDSIVHPKVWDVLKLASIKWKESNPDVRNAWEQRTAILNSHPIPGRYDVVPPEVAVPSVGINMITGLYLDWRFFSQTMGPIIIRKPRNGYSDKSYKFGKEKVNLGT